MLYSSSGQERSTLASEISALILPEAAVVGRSIKSIFDTEIDTATMEIDATLMLKKGDEAGITKYKYVGNLIADSRPWCVSHINKVLTKEEIMKWSGYSWAGKKAGNPFVVRGGWRCRHHFAPVIDG